MRKSQSVPASLLIALSATLVGTGCSNRSVVQRCMETSTRRIVSDSYCSSNTPGYFWGYGGSTTRGMGGMLIGSGFSRTRPTDTTIRNTSGRTVYTPPSKSSSSFGGFGSGRSGGSFGG
jgi:hypothetical protein